MDGVDRVRARPGGRSADVRARVFGAVREALEGGDPAALTIEEVARRSGVHKATIYRRWLSTAGLVADLLVALTPVETPLPDTGDLRQRSARRRHPRRGHDRQSPVAGDAAARHRQLRRPARPRRGRLLGQPVRPHRDGHPPRPATRPGSDRRRRRSRRSSRCWPRSTCAPSSPTNRWTPHTSPAGLSEEGVDGVLVGAVVGAHDDAVDDLVGEHLDAVEFAAVVLGGDPLDLDRAPVVAEDGDAGRGRGCRRTVRRPWRGTRRSAPGRCRCRRPGWCRAGPTRRRGRSGWRRWRGRRG